MIDPQDKLTYEARADARQQRAMQRSLVDIDAAPKLVYTSGQAPLLLSHGHHKPGDMVDCENVRALILGYLGTRVGRGRHAWQVRIEPVDAGPEAA